MIIKKYSILTFIASLLLLMSIGFAHVEEVTNTGHSEEGGLSHQFEEILPFHHFAEGHMFAGAMLIVLWISLFYTIYTTIQMLAKRRKR